MQSLNKHGTSPEQAWNKLTAEAKQAFCQSADTQSRHAAGEMHLGGLPPEELGSCVAVIGGICSLELLPPQDLLKKRASSQAQLLPKLYSLLCLQVGLILNAETG